MQAAPASRVDIRQHMPMDDRMRLTENDGDTNDREHASMRGDIAGMRSVLARIQWLALATFATLAANLAAVLLKH